MTKTLSIKRRTQIAVRWFSRHVHVDEDFYPAEIIIDIISIHDLPRRSSTSQIIADGYAG